MTVKIAGKKIPCELLEKVGEFARIKTLIGTVVMVRLSSLCEGDENANKNDVFTSKTSQCSLR